MNYLVMIYCDDTLLDARPAGEFDTLMHGGCRHADDLRTQAPSTARPLRDLGAVWQRVSA